MGIRGSIRPDQHPSHRIQDHFTQAKRCPFANKFCFLRTHSESDPGSSFDRHGVVIGPAYRR